jgi:hypothetical protein
MLEIVVIYHCQTSVQMSTMIDQVRIQYFVQTERIYEDIFKTERE